MIWIVNAYSLLQAAFIFLSGSFGDHYGRKRVYLIGIVIFALSSFVCATTDSADVLIMARALQGIGSGLMITCSLAIVAAFFFHHRRSWAIGVWSGFTMLISGAGPILGGWLTEMGMWRMIFLINIPLSLVAIFILIIYVPESYDEEAPKELDISGTFLSTMALMLSGFFCIEGPRRGFDDPLVLLSGGAAVAILPIFIWIEGHSDHPMMPLNLFRSRTFTGANTLTLLLYGALNSVLFFLPLKLIQVQGYSAAAVGLALLPMTVLMVALSFVMSRVFDRYGPRLPLIIGPVLISLSFVMLATLPPDSGQDSYWTTLFPAICLFGAGMGVTLGAIDHGGDGIGRRASCRHGFGAEQYGFAFGASPVDCGHGRHRAGPVQTEPLERSVGHGAAGRRPRLALRRVDQTGGDSAAGSLTPAERAQLQA